MDSSTPGFPIADSIYTEGAGDPARQFRYEYVLDAFPAKPEWIPRVQYRWFYDRSAASSGDWQELVGWQRGFDVIVPAIVGQDTLNVELRLFHGTHEFSPEARAHRLFVVFEDPEDISMFGEYLGAPRVAWLEVATEWADGESTEAGVLEALTRSIYENPFGWAYLRGGTTFGDPISLIERAADTGICSDFRDSWRVLAAILGIETGLRSYNPDKPGTKQFLTSPRPALDGASMNVINDATGVRERYIFTNHQLGLDRQETAFYDPTFGLTGSYEPDPGDPYPDFGDDADLEGNVFCKEDAAIPDPVLLCPSGLPCCHVLGLPSAALTLLPKTDPSNHDDFPRFKVHNARGLKQAVRDDLVATLPTGDATIDLKVNAAIGHLDESLADAWWEDDHRLTVDGQGVFAEEGSAAEELLEIDSDERIFGAAAETLILIDATLARVAIDQAAAAPVYPDELALAQARLAKGSQQQICGSMGEAVNSFGDGWLLAQMAMGRLAPAPVPGDELFPVLLDVQALIDDHPGSELAAALETLLAELEALTACRPDRMEAVTTAARAVREVRVLVWSGLLGGDRGTPLMAGLSSFARQMAVDAIDDAASEGGARWRLAVARWALARGDRRHRAGRYQAATFYYRMAVRMAGRSLPPR